MKTETILIIGGLALAGYYLYTKNKLTPVTPAPAAPVPANGTGPTAGNYYDAQGNRFPYPASSYPGGVFPSANTTQAPTIQNQLFTAGSPVITGLATGLGGAITSWFSGSNTDSGHSEDASQAEEFIAG